MGFNLENEKIQDTYEQLVQVSGSTLVDGTGSLLAVVFGSASFASFALTASFALNGGGGGSIDTSSLVTTASFNAYTASNDASVASKVATSTFNAYTSSNNSVVNALVAATSSYVLVGSDVSLLINDANYAIATNISGAFNSTSSSLSSRITTNTSNIGTLTSQTSSYARTNVNNNFSGTQNFVNIAVSGTASIGHVQTITGSAVIIGEEFIILNASTPAARYAGLVVFDSGSTPATASFEWDGLTDNWIIMEETGNTAVVLTGPTGSRGAEVLPTVDRLQKGGGHHQLMDSNITDNGTLVSVSTPLTATQITASSGFKGDLDGNAETATSALTASLAFFADTSSFAVTAVSASHAETSSFANVFNVDTLLKVGNVIRGGNFNTNSSGNRNIVFGQNNSMQATDSILLGGEDNIVGVNGNYSGIYSSAASQITSGDTSVILGGYQNQINGGLRSIIIGGTQVINSQDLSVTLGKLNFTAGNPNTTYVDNFESTGSLNHSGSVSADVFNIRTSLTLDSLVPTFVSSGSRTGSLIDNIHPAIASSSAQVKHIVTLTQDQYDATSVFNDTLYVITDLTGSSTSLNNLTVTGELDLSGSVSSKVVSLSVASSTASVDLSTSNFFERTLTAPTFLANPTNAKAGSTYTFRFNSGSLISDYGSDYRFVGGTYPTLSNGQDIVTFVSFLSGSAVKLYGTGLANFQ